MKKIFTFFAAVLFTLGFLLPNIAMAQAPDKISYQSIIRSNSNTLLTNQSLGMQISILQGSASGTAVYVETQNPTSNINGLVSLEIGTGTVVSGSMSSINWKNGPYFIKTEIDPSGGTYYTISGATEILSVPYALYGEDADADPTNELDNTDNQTLTLSGSNLSISGGNSVTLPTSSGGDNWGTQTVVSNTTLSGNGISGSPLAVNGDLTDDQTLSISGSNLSITGGNTVTLPMTGSTCWTTGGSNIYNSNSGYVGVGTTAPSFKLDMQAISNAYINIKATGTSTSYGGMLLDRPNTNSKMRIFFRTASSNKWVFGQIGTNENLSISRNTITDDGTFHINHTTGYIGIGTTSPSAKLHIPKLSGPECVIGDYIGTATATTATFGNTTQETVLYLGQSSTYKGFLIWDYNSTSTNAIFKIGTYGGYNDMVLQSAGGNVGVGANPDCRFHVTGPEIRLSNSLNSELTFYRSTTEIANITANSSNLLIQTENSGGIYINSEDIVNLNVSSGLGLSVRADKKIGINTTAPTSDLTIKQTSATPGLTFEYYIGTYSPWTIYRTTSFLRFAFNGTSVAYINNSTGAWVSSSDLKLKENITEMEPVLDRINQLRTVRYNFIDRDNSNTIGFIAQDVLPLFPEVVSKPDDESAHYGIAYGQMSIIAIKAIQEQQEIIDEQNNQIIDLQKQIDELREIMIND